MGKLQMPTTTTYQTRHKTASCKIYSKLHSNLGLKIFCASGCSRWKSRDGVKKSELFIFILLHVDNITHQLKKTNW